MNIQKRIFPTPWITMILLYSLTVVAALDAYSQRQSSGTAPILPVNGFIVTMEGDTIPGSIKYKKMVENHISQIRFTGPDGEDHFINAGEIRSCGIEVYHYYEEAGVWSAPFWDVYECRPSPKKGLPIFMNRFDKGRITVFKNRSSMGHSKTSYKTTSRSLRIS